MNGAEVVAEILKREGTEFLACYPRNPLIEACSNLDMRPIIPRQERVGVGIADGFSRNRRGKQIGVFAAQHGPGIENAFAGVAQAYSENVPLLVLPAGFPPSRQHTQPTFRAAEVFRPVTKYTAMAHAVEDLPDTMRRAYQALRSGKGGPVLVEIPTNVFEANFEGDLDYHPVAVQRTAPDPDAISQAAKMLLAARHPIIWAGQGVLYAEASEQLLALAELAGAPIVMTNPGKGAVPESHPLALGASTRSRPKMYQHFLNKADLILAIGSSMTRTSFGPPIPLGKTIIHSTNDPSDINKDCRADHAIVGDARLVTDALIEEVDRLRSAPNIGIEELKAEIAAIKAEWHAEWSAQFKSDEVPINQYRVLGELLQTVDRDNAIVTHDSGSPREQTLPFWETTKAGGYMGWGKSTQLGYGLGITMGAKLAAPDKQCINIMGDSSFGMTGMDIETASRCGIAIMTVVFNNSVMAAERDVLTISNEKYNAMAVGGNYSKVAEGLNVASRRVTAPSEIGSAIKEGLDETSKGRPFLLEVVVKQGYEFSRYT